MTDEQFRRLTEGEQNTCSLCRDWNLGDCDKCELNLRGSDSIDSERMVTEGEEY